MKTRATAFLFFMLFCFYGFGADKSESGVLIVGSSANSEESTIVEPVAQEDAILYDASELPVSKFDKVPRSELLDDVPKQFRIYVEDFSAEELDTFLKKKAAYIVQLTSAMTKVKLSVERIGKVIEFVELQFYKSSRLLLQANSTGGQYKFLIRTGLAFNTAFLQKHKISKTRFVRYLSSKKGYFYLFAGGIGLSRVVDPQTNKSHLILDLNVTKEDLKSVTSIITELATMDILVFGMTMDVRRGNFNNIFFDRGRSEQMATYLGPAGRIVRDQSRLTFEFPVSIPFVTSISAPPIASGLAFFDSNVTVYRYSLNLSQLQPKEILDKIWSLFRRADRQDSACLRFYSN